MPRRLGQHFLRDPRVLGLIASLIPPGSVVVELGAGRGELTLRLAERASRVYAIELDRRLAAELARRVPGNVEVIVGDVLEVDWPVADYVVGNIPYYITSPILLRAMRRGDRCVFTVQLEVARRLVARPGSPDYGRLSAIAQCLYSVELVAKVPPTAFDPPPRVWSAVIRMLPLGEPCTRDVEGFEALTARLFSQRRKLVRRVLPGAPPDLANRRVYELGPRDIARLLDSLNA